MTAHAHHDHHEVLHLARQVLESGLQLADGASDERLVGDLAVVAANGLQQRLARRALVHVAELETPPIDLVCRVALQEMFHEQVRLLRLRQLLQVRCGGGGCVLRTRLVRTRILVLVRRLLQPSFDRLDLSLHRLLVQIIVQIIIYVREIFLLSLLPFRVQRGHQLLQVRNHRVEAVFLQVREGPLVLLALVQLRQRQRLRLSTPPPPRRTRARSRSPPP